MKLLRHFSKAYWAAWIATLLFFGAFYILLVPLPLYLAKVGLPEWQIGIILGAFGVASLFLRPLAGVLADRWGYRRVMLAGTVAFIVGVVGTSLATSPILLFGLRVLQTAGYVAFTTAATALVADLASPDRRGAALAVFGIAANVAMTLTPAAVEAGLAALTLRGAFWLAGALSALAAVLAMGAYHNAEASMRGLRLRSLLRVPSDLYSPMVAAGLFGVAFGAFLLFLPMLSTSRALGTSGLAYAVYGISIIGTRMATGRLLDRGNRSQFVALAFVAMALGLVGYAFARSQLVLIPSTVLIAIGSGILHPLLITVHMERLPESDKGRASAAFYLSFDLGIGLGTWLLSPALVWWSLREVFLIAGLAALVGVTLARPVAARLRAVDRAG